MDAWADLKPLMYGYVRASVGSAAVEELERRLRDVADAEGFCFAATFIETRPGERGALCELVAELRRAEAHHVVVPSLDHLSRHAGVLDEMIEQLRESAGAHVWTADRTASPVCRL